MSALSTLARRAGLGRVVLYAYHRPIGLTKIMMREGGPYQQWRTRQGHKAMTEAATTLPPLEAPEEAYPVPIRFLSGARFWDQTLFCLYSLQKNADRRVDAKIFDDGTLSVEVQDKIRRVIPWVQFVLADEVMERLEAQFPRDRCPNLRARREDYPHLRKLTDLHDPEEISLVLDSDMLFFRRPDALLDWMSAPEGVIYMQDVERAYGYSRQLMDRLGRGVVPEKMNVGLYGMPGAMIDSDYLEHCCEVMLETEGASYLQEQGMTALLVSGQPATELSRADYCVMPDLEEGARPTAALHHYVAESKRSYFQHGWRQIVEASALT